MKVEAIKLAYPTPSYSQRNNEKFRNELIKQINEWVNNTHRKVLNVVYDKDYAVGLDTSKKKVWMDALWLRKWIDLWA